MPDPVVHDDVTGDGVPEYIDVTNRIGCGACHGQLVTDFSGQMRVFKGGLFPGQGACPPDPSRLPGG